MLGEHDGVDLAHGAFHRVVDDKVIVGVGSLKLDLGAHEALLHLFRAVEDAFLEYAEYVGNFYGTPKKFVDEAMEQDDLFYYNALPKMPQGVRDSINAVGPPLAMPVITAICPVIGMLATGVKVAVHGKMNSLNLISYIAGDFASGKGSIDPVIDAWTSEVKAMDKLYHIQQEMLFTASHHMCQM